MKPNNRKWLKLIENLDGDIDKSHKIDFPQIGVGICYEPFFKTGSDAHEISDRKPESTLLAKNLSSEKHY